MLKMNKYKKIILMFLVFIMLVPTLTGCDVLENWIKGKKGQLIGESFSMSIYNDYGIETASLNGEHISIGQYAGKATYDAEGNKTSKFDSEVLEITIDGHQLLHVGSTLIFEEEKLDKIYTYDNNGKTFDEIISNTNNINVSVEGKGGFIPVDKLINKLGNNIGKSKVIVISSQVGTPLMVYQGNNVYVEVPENLPKMTRITIDGKSLYLHRVEYQIYDTQMFK